MTVSNGLSTSTATRTITIVAPPGPVVSFTALPASGTDPLTVSFTNASTGSPTLTYLWDLGDGSAPVTTNIPAPHSYSAGTYTVTLTVTDGFAQSNSAQRTITVAAAQCTVPDFTPYTTADGIQAKWNAAGFSTTVIFNPIPPPDYPIKKQDLQRTSLPVQHGSPDGVQMRRHSGRRAANGQGMVEFALIFPVLILLFVAIFDVGRLVFAYNGITNAAREGARLGIVDQTGADIQAEVINQATSLGLVASQVEVRFCEPDGTACTTTKPIDLDALVQVRVTYAWSAMTPIIGNILGPISVVTVSRMPIERVYP